MELDLPTVKLNGKGSKSNDGDLFDVSLTDEEYDKKNYHNDTAIRQSSHFTSCNAFSSLNPHMSSPSVSSEDMSRSPSQTRDPTPSAAFNQISSASNALGLGIPDKHVMPDGVDSDSQLSEASAQSAQSAHSTFSGRSGILSSAALADLNAELCDLKRTLHAESAHATAALLASHVPDLSLVDLSLDERRASTATTTTPGSVSASASTATPSVALSLSLSSTSASATAIATASGVDGSEGTLSCASSQSHSVATPSSPALGVLVRPRAAPGGAVASAALPLPPHQSLPPPPHSASASFSKGAPQSTPFSFSTVFALSFEALGN